MSYESDGLVWESRAERDAAIGAGRVEEALRANPCRGVVEVLDEHGVLPENRVAALEELLRWEAIRRLARR